VGRGLHLSEVETAVIKAFREVRLLADRRRKALKAMGQAEELYLEVYPCGDWTLWSEPEDRPSWKRKRLAIAAGDVLEGWKKIADIPLPGKNWFRTDDEEEE